MLNKQVKIAVTGAAGQIGYAFLFRLASGAVFGPDVSIDLNLIEVTPAMNALSGVKMELDDCAFPLINRIIVTDDLSVGFQDVNWAILIGSAPRGPGMERSELLSINGGIFAEQGKQLAMHAASDVKVFVVGNPCNTNAMIAMNHAEGIPKDHFFAMTTLDENRAKAQLALKANVAVESISQMAIYGNHSATQFPDFFHAIIDEEPVQSVISDNAWLETQFIKTVQQRGAEIIRTRGASSAASAANGIVDGIRALTGQLDNGTVFSMAVCSAGQYGAEAGLIVSYPCKWVNDKVEVITSFNHTPWAAEQIKISLDELKAERDMVIELGLVNQAQRL